MPGAADAADRESRTEVLLVEGLDHYFQGRFDEAIHLWTRVLFVDRTHARARAYINRARTAQGEHLRRADEMLHTAGDLLNRGELDQARRLLANAEQASGADEKVAELWARLERVERTRRMQSTDAPVAVVDARPVRSWRWTLRVATQVAAAAAVGVFLAVLLTSPVVGEWMAGGSRNATAGVAASSRPLEVLSSDDAALVRARRLYAGGRLAEALLLLDRLDAQAGQRDVVDQLRVEIQRWLLMPREGTSTATPPTGDTQP